MKIPATPYRPTSWTSDLLNINKLNQMSNNDQWLFENTPRVRYNSSGLIRDNGIKIMAGKSVIPPSATDYSDVTVYFGSFFTAGCKPVVTCTVGDSPWGLRKLVVTRGLGGEIDSRGFIGHVSSQEPVGGPADIRGGWMHWQAVGY